MRNTVTKFSKCPIRAFTLLEGLLSLALVSLLALSLSGGVKTSLARLEETLFFMRFEQLYLDSQRLSLARQEELIIWIGSDGIASSDEQVNLPAGLVVSGPDRLVLSARGGNSSLARLQFRSSDREVTYQFFIGSGRYKKTSKSLYSP